MTEQTETTSALKEWAAVEALLRRGDIVLLPRKGGIIERRGEFEVEHDRFWLFPTQYHQNPPELRPEARWALDAAKESRPTGGALPIRLLLAVDAAWRVEDEAVLERIAAFQPYGMDTLRARFHYRDKPYLHLLLVRTFERDHPFLLPRRPSYRGCVSWVPLEAEVPEDGLRPVLEDDEFSARRAEIKGALAGVEVVLGD